MIRPVKPSDAQAICNIYNYYIVNTIITFEETEVTAGEMEQRIKDITSRHPWLVYEENGRVTGYTYASLWKTRSAYRYSVESAIYLLNGSGGKGIGRQLYEALFAELKRLEIHAVIGGIALPNDASIALHDKLGFREVAHFREVGLKFGQWIDVGYWQKLL